MFRSLPCPACPLRSRWSGTCCQEHHRRQTSHLGCADRSPAGTQGTVRRESLSVTISSLGHLGYWSLCTRIFSYEKLGPPVPSQTHSALTLTRKSPIWRELRISHMIFRHSASGIMGSNCPAMSKSCKEMGRYSPQGFNLLKGGVGKGVKTRPWALCFFPIKACLHSCTHHLLHYLCDHQPRGNSQHPGVSYQSWFPFCLHSFIISLIHFSLFSPSIVGANICGLTP